MVHINKAPALYILQWGKPELELLRIKWKEDQRKKREKKNKDKELGNILLTFLFILPFHPHSSPFFFISLLLFLLTTPLGFLHF
jgi:hypothetical protein